MPQQLNRRPSKIYDVPIAQMRVPPALLTQREFRKSHGDKISAELDLDKLGLPVMNHRDGIFWVLDGQHRLYALKQWGFGDQKIPCIVYEGLSDSEAADMFLGLDARRAIGSYDKFHIACTAGRNRETAIRRAIESQGLKPSRDQKDGCIGALSACGRVYDRAGAANPQTGEVVLGQVLRTLNKAFGGDAGAFEGSAIEGLGFVFTRFNGKTNEKEMASQLAVVPQGVRGILRRAESMRAKTGNQKTQCVAAVIVDLYNKATRARGKDRLPSWWKEETGA